MGSELIILESFPTSYTLGADAHYDVPTENSVELKIHLLGISECLTDIFVPCAQEVQGK